MHYSTNNDSLSSVSTSYLSSYLSHLLLGRNENSDYLILILKVANTFGSIVTCQISHTEEGKARFKPRPFGDS